MYCNNILIQSRLSQSENNSDLKKQSGKCETSVANRLKVEGKRDDEH